MMLGQLGKSRTPLLHQPMVPSHQEILARISSSEKILLVTRVLHEKKVTRISPNKLFTVVVPDFVDLLMKQNEMKMNLTRSKTLSITTMKTLQIHCTGQSKTMKHASEDVTSSDMLSGLD